MLKEKGWAIKGTWSRGKEFFYAGWHKARKDIINEHVDALGYVSWQKCKRRTGCSCVRVEIREIRKGI